MEGKSEKKHGKDRKGGKKTAQPAPKNKKNTKAFNVANVVSAKRNQQRNLDKAQQKEKVPLRNAAGSADQHPPDLIVVMGPRGCGKSTLIRSLVKLYTGQNLVDILGPVTVVAGDRKRLTFFECPIDLYSMTDLAKVADLVIVMIDASYGFEMETFEFLNLLQLHGMPKVIGVLTHLDSFKSTKSLQNTKKAIKHRFWTEIFKGAKLFDMMGTINRKYRKHEVKRLALAISRVKYRPLVWRNSHPYVLVDRVEEGNTSAEHRADGLRDIILYGYVRGTHLKASQKVHLIGAGDFDIAELTSLADPCPLANGSSGGLMKKRKDSLLYAPMANVGRVVLDGDNLYIDLKQVHYSSKDTLYIPDQQHSMPSQAPETGPMSLLRSLQDVKQGIDTQLESRAQQSMQLFADSDAVAGVRYDDDKDEEDDEGDDDGEEDEEEDDGEGVEDDEGEEDREGEEEEEEDGEDQEDEENDDVDDEDEDGEEDDHAKFGFADNYDDEDNDQEEEEDGENPLSSSDRARSERVQAVMDRELGAWSKRDIMDEVYGDVWDQAKQKQKQSTRSAAKTEDGDDNEEEDEEDFFVVKRRDNRTGVSSGRALDRLDSSRSSPLYLSSGQHPALGSAERQAYGRGTTLYHHFKSRFAAGNPLAKRAVTKSDGGEEEEEDAENVIEALGQDDDDEEVEGGDDDNSEAEERANDKIDAALRQLHGQKKAMFSAKMGEQLQTEAIERQAKKLGLSTDDADERNLIEEAQRRFLQQSERNAAEFGKEGEIVRTTYEGYRQGLYVRVLLRTVPQEFLENFRAQHPVVLGGLLPNETALGFITARVKRHRWHKRILKSQDPLIFSVGWRRYQSIPLYTTTDANERDRYLKYTPEHMHCTATFYGPLVAPNTGILAYQVVDARTAQFRIAMTGTALEQRATPQVKKKLKLVGTPVKIFKNTAFITGMFSTALEAAKFEHARIKTVSGIRGSIKKAVMEHRRQETGGSKGLALPPGTVRASFEDKILMSDIVICRLWVNVDVKRFYNPVLSLLTPAEAPKQLGNGDAEDGSGSEGEDGNSGSATAAAGMLMRTTAQLRRDLQVPQVVNKDSVYKPIVRQERVFNKLKIPSKLQAALPFKSRVKHTAPKNREGYLARRAVVLEPEERKTRALLAAVTTIAKDKESKRKLSDDKRQKERQKQKERDAARFADVHKQEKKKRYREEGLAKQHQAARAAGEGGGGRAKKRARKN